jgi:TnsA-like endonuclease N terminal
MAAAHAGAAVEAVADPGFRVCGFELEFREAGGAQRREALSVCGAEPLEDALPVRPFHFEKGGISFAGWRWLATTGCHVGFESWLERDHLTLLDFDRDIVAVAAQPFWLHWRDPAGKPRRHAPDYFARRRDGCGVVIDVRPDDRIPARDAEAFAVTSAACEVAGWEFRRVGVIDPVLMANVRWLSRYRHDRCRIPHLAAALLAVFGDCRELFDGVSLVGDRLAVLPVAYNLLWRGDLSCDLAVRLGPGTLVGRGPR